MEDKKNIMKIIILSPDKNWKHIKEDIKFLIERLKKIDIEIVFDIKYFPLFHVPREEYLIGKWGLNRRFLSGISSMFDFDIIVLHAPNFQVVGADGWYSKINNKPFIQIFREIKSKMVRNDEFKYRVSEILIHELCHKLSIHFNINDRTHYWELERGSLQGKIDEIIMQKLRKDKITLIKKSINLIKQLINRKITNREKTLQVIKPLYCFHHSATDRDTTRVETIIRKQREKYKGKTFYDFIIDSKGIIHKGDPIKKTRGTIDICVLGDFTRQEPTIEQINACKTFDGDWTSHKELAHKGLATPSVCPGNLMKFLY